MCYQFEFNLMYAANDIINLMRLQINTLQYFNNVCKYNSAHREMMRQLLTIVNFSTVKNYTSTFKIRSRLSQFFKHVHPDQLAQAPVKVKQQNLRSLTNFNSYIDSLSQSKPVQAKLLKFYIAEKTNTKSKKFFSFTVELPEIGNRQSDMTQDKAKALVDNIVEVLNKKFIQSKNFKSKHGKVNEDRVQKIENIKFNQKQTQEQRFNRMSANIKPFEHKSKINEFYAESLKNALNTKYMEAQKQTLSTKLKKTISFADTGSNKPLIWSRIANEQSGIYKDYQKIMDELIDPRLIYFDQSLNLAEIQQFKKRLLPGSMDRESYKSSKIILQVCNKMESFDPPICFYVSNKYSSTEIPGFLTIPYNFNVVDLAKFYEKQIDTIVAEQQKFEQYFDYQLDLVSQLKTQNNFQVDQTHFKNNSDIWSRILMLKRLQKYQSQKLIGITVFQKSTFDLFKNKYQISNPATVVIYNGKIFMTTEFSDADMQKVIQDINSKESKTK